MIGQVLKLIIERMGLDKMQDTYKHGLPFSESLDKNIVELDNRVMLKKASMLVIDGAVGLGKTTLAVHCADRVNALHGVDPIKLELKDHPQLAMGGADFLKKMRICWELNLPVIIYDEAGDFTKRGAISRFNSMLNRTFETYRGFKILVILLLPRFYVLDSHLFDLEVPRGLIHVVDRNEKYADFSGYSLVSMNWIRYWVDKLPKAIRYKAYDKVIPNIRGHSLDLDSVRSKQLDRISTREKIEILKKAEVKADGLLSYKDLADKTSRSMIWVKKKVAEMKMKESRKIGRVKYFKEDVLNRLVDVIEGND